MSNTEKKPVIRVIKKPDGVPAKTATRRETPIAGFEIMGGIIAYDPDMSPATNRQLGCLVMASLGFSNRQIGKSLFISENTVKTHIGNGAEREHIDNQRSTFARHFFDTGVFRLVRPAESLRLSPTKRKIANLASLGKSNDEIATDTTGDPERVGVHLRNITRRTGLHGREQIIIGALVSQEIGDYALHAINLSSPDTWAPDGGLIIPEPRAATPQQEVVYARN